MADYTLAIGRSLSGNRQRSRSRRSSNQAGFAL